MTEGTADVPHQIVDTRCPKAASVFAPATALDTVSDMVDPQPTLVELLIRHVLLPRALLPQIGINSHDCGWGLCGTIMHVAPFTGDSD